MFSNCYICNNFLMIAKYSPCDFMSTGKKVITSLHSCVSGFGFYSAQDWEIFKSAHNWQMFGPMRNENETAEQALCNHISEVWSEQHQEDSQEFCRPQWDGIASCIPSTPINQSAVLPCIESFHSEYFDTSCESNLMFPLVPDYEELGETWGFSEVS